MCEMATGHFQVTSHGQFRTNQSPPNYMKLNTKNKKVNSVTTFIHKSFFDKFYGFRAFRGYVVLNSCQRNGHLSLRNFFNHAANHIIDNYILSAIEAGFS